MRKALFWNWAGPGILFLAGVGVELMPNVQNWLWSGIVWGIAFLWFLGVLVYRRRHRNGNILEIRIIPNKWLGNYESGGKPGKNPFYAIRPGHSITAIFGLEIVNHSVEHKAHITSAELSLQKPHIIGKTTLFSIPLVIQGHPNDYPFKDIEIPAQSKTSEFTFNMHKAIPTIIPFPRKSKLMLVLQMIGPTRKIEYGMEEITHDPKLIPDIPDWKKQ